MLIREAPLLLSDADRAMLEWWVRSSTLASGLARRARIVLLAAEPRSGAGRTTRSATSKTPSEPSSTAGTNAANPPSGPKTPKRSSPKPNANLLHTRDTSRARPDLPRPHQRPPLNHQITRDPDHLHRRLHNLRTGRTGRSPPLSRRPWNSPVCNGIQSFTDAPERPGANPMIPPGWVGSRSTMEVIHGFDRRHLTGATLWPSC